MVNKYRLRLLAFLIVGVSGAPLSSEAGEPAALTPMGYRLSYHVYVPRDLVARTCTNSLKSDHPRMDFQKVIFLYLPSPLSACKSGSGVWSVSGPPATTRSK